MSRVDYDVYPFVVVKNANGKEIQRMNPNQCVLCFGGNVRQVCEYPTDRIAAGWREKFKIDVGMDFGEVSRISLLCCEECGLLYYFPRIFASDGLYSNLQLFDWYYMGDKWEFQEALRDLPLAGRLLEVGCGSGEFLQKAAGHGFRIEGIDVNSEAVKLAKTNHLSVSNIDLVELAKLKPGEYDAVCAFQVLEHVPDPAGFLSACVRLLKVGGRLVFSVPNEDSFIHYDPQDLLNQPPHHSSRWSHRVVVNLQRLLPIKLVRVSFEPLAEYHLDWYLSVQQNRLSGKNPLSRLAQRSIGELFNRVIRPYKMYRWIRGHTMYCCYQKIID